jgi:hypothetical protein
MNDDFCRFKFCGDGMDGEHIIVLDREASELLYDALLIRGIWW